ncbi:cobalamin adenosyltransferase [Halorientalis sp. IM1011]|uniref:cob(I)yrinic acid a,c-diamide adenosyltransferase n=1 Tax=Halorientalis sp. IM1011 TaxID=1932360 RepID=UPI00097CC845|nr:cob(I)yrinic acid a,c-diamide adenosyltransferase [Halorientalis sp. IM1011]AQL42062.1 cobalamin adenosyltransferase [Halorientalis sp. IM1011]
MTDATDDADDPLGPHEIEPSAPEEFGLVQVWWGDGKGKTTAALGMGFRAAGHGYRVHVLQFMKGGTSSVEDVRGEYNAMATMPGISYENAGHYGWHGFVDGSEDDEHEARARGALARARELIDGAADADLTSSFPLDGDPDDGVHMLVLDEVLYAANRGLIDPDDVIGLIEDKPEDLELVLTGGHDRPEYVTERADLVTEVGKGSHPIEAGQGARKGTEF